MTQGGVLWGCLQPGHVRDQGDGADVGDLPAQQGGQHVPQARPRPQRLERQGHCLQLKGTCLCVFVQLKGVCVFVQLKGVCVCLCNSKVRVCVCLCSLKVCECLCNL